MAASLALGVRFTAASSGSGSFVDAGAVNGYRGGAGLTNGKTYRYRAESATLSEWEWGTGVWTSGTSTLTRVLTVSSTGSAVSFTAAPQVAITIEPGDVLSFTDVMTLTQAEKNQGRSNIDLAVGQIGATATNDSAASGKVGEYVSSSVAYGSPVSLVSGTAANVTSISLSAGDWDVSGSVSLLGSGTLTNHKGAVTNTSATMPTYPNGGSFYDSSVESIAAPGTSSFVPANSVGTTRLSLAGTTTVYLVAQASFSGSMGVAGFIGARRAR
jgi:hypothetical protein